MKKLLLVLLGFIIGGGITLYILTSRLADEMIVVKQSKLSFAETVTVFEEKAIANGWKVPKVYDLQKSLADENYEIKQVKVLSICKPKYAYKILSNDDYRNISAMMPCRVSVFEVETGEVFLAYMNSAMMSKMFGGEVEEIMSAVSNEQKVIMSDIVFEEMN